MNINKIPCTLLINDVSLVGIKKQIVVNSYICASNYYT